MPASRWTVVTVVLAAAACFGQAGATGEQKGFVDGLDPSRLAESLQRYGMTELLETFVAQQGADSIMGQSLLAQLKATSAGRSGVSPEARGKLLDEAVRLLENVLATVTKRPKRTPEQELERFGYMLRLVEVAGVSRVEPAAKRLMYLQGGPADRAEIVQHTAGAAAAANRLFRQAERTLQEWRLPRNDEIYIVHGPDLERLLRTALYRSGWVHFYRGMALPAGQAAKDTELNRANLAAERFVEDAQSGVMYVCQLLTGRVFRELGVAQGGRLPAATAKARALRKRLGRATDAQTRQDLREQLGTAEQERSDIERRRDAHHAEAARWIERVDSPRAGEDLRIDAMFEAARNLIEWGRRERVADDGKVTVDWSKYEEAAQAIETFRKTGYELIGSQARARIWIDLLEAMLRHYLFESRAAARTPDEPDKAAEDAGQAFKALFAFYRKHNDLNVQREFLRIIAEKYRHVTAADYDRANSLILMALAFGAPTPDEALTLLTKVLDRDNPISGRLHSLALWERGKIYNQCRENEKAARDFLAIAERFPEDKNAEKGALNAVVTYSSVVKERRRQDAAVGINLQDGLIHAIEVLLRHWGATPGNAKWAFDLGWEYEDKAARAGLPPDQRVALLRKAVAAYEKTPADRPESLQAAKRALDIRSHILIGTWDQAGLERVKQAREARELVADLIAYGQRAERAAGTMTDKARAATLTEWAAESQLEAIVLRYERLRQRTQAMREVRQFQEHWAGTPAQREAMEFEIRKLIESSRTDEAIGKVRQLRAADPEKAKEVIRLIVDQIRSQISDLKYAPRKSDELRDYQNAYLEFAKNLYDRAREDPDLTAGQKIAFRQMYADALVNVGRFEQALKEFQATSTFNENARQKKVAQIEKTSAARGAAVEAAKDDKPGLLKLVEQHRQDLQAYGVDLAGSDAWGALKAAADRLVSAKGKADVSRELPATAYRLRAAVESLKQEQVRGVARDATDMLGLARCHAGRKAYEKALDLYNKLASGLAAGREPKDLPRIYWHVELERVRCIAQAKRNDAKAMARLVVLIKQLRALPSEMGGLVGEFNKVEDAAKLAAGR